MIQLFLLKGVTAQTPRLDCDSAQLAFVAEQLMPHVTITRKN